MLLCLFASARCRVRFCAGFHCCWESQFKPFVLLVLGWRFNVSVCVCLAVCCASLMLVLYVGCDCLFNRGFVCGVDWFVKVVFIFRFARFCASPWGVLSMLLFLCVLCFRLFTNLCLCVLCIF